MGQSRRFGSGSIINRSTRSTSQKISRPRSRETRVSFFSTLSGFDAESAADHRRQAHLAPAAERQPRSRIGAKVDFLTGRGSRWKAHRRTIAVKFSACERGVSIIAAKRKYKKERQARIGRRARRAEAAALVAFYYDRGPQFSRRAAATIRSNFP